MNMGKKLMNQEIVNKSIDIASELSDKVIEIIGNRLSTVVKDDVSLELISSYVSFSIWVTHLSAIKEARGLDDALRILDYEFKSIKAYFIKDSGDTEEGTSSDA